MANKNIQTSKKEIPGKPIASKNEPLKSNRSKRDNTNKTYTVLGKSNQKVSGNLHSKQQEGIKTSTLKNSIKQQHGNTTGNRNIQDRKGIKAQPDKKLSKSQTYQVIGGMKGNNPLSKSLPNNLNKEVQKEAQKSQQNRKNQPQPDGQVQKNLQKQGNPSNNPAAKKTGVQTNSVQKTQQTLQTPGNQTNRLQKTAPGVQKPVNQVNGLQKIASGAQRVGVSSNSMQKTNQTNKIQTNVPGGQKPGTQTNTSNKNVAGGQITGNRTNVTQKNIPVGQKLGTQTNTVQKTKNVAGGQIPGSSTNITQKNVPGGQKLGTQANTLQRTVAGGLTQVNKANIQKPVINQSNNLQRSQQTGQKPGIQINNSQKGQQGITKPGTSKTEAPVKTGQKPSISNNNQKLQGSSNKNDLTPRKQGLQDQITQNRNRTSNSQTPGNISRGPGGRTSNMSQVQRNISRGPGDRMSNSSQNQGSIPVGPGDKKKKKKKQVDRRSQPAKPQIIESPAGVTTVSLADAQLLMDEVEKLKNDENYGAIAEFLTQLLQKLQNLDTANFTRTEVDFFVRQFQDYNEGFHYRMDASPRGHALLLVNSEFYKVPGDPFSYELEDRPGAEIDANNLEEIFTEMGYLVTRRDNLKHWEMAWELKIMSEYEHKKFNSFICVISSHGNLNQVFGCDGLKMTLSKEIRQLRSEKCPGLAGKPKLFFLQSCQSVDEEPPNRAESTVPKPGELEKSRFIINDVDFLVGYSTIPGNLSYRHEQSGSWYLNSLYKNLKENYKKYDIISILEDVNFDVNNKKDQYNYLDSNQVPMFSSTLRGPVFWH